MTITEAYATEVPSAPEDRRIIHYSIFENDEQFTAWQIKDPSIRVMQVSLIAASAEGFKKGSMARGACSMSVATRIQEGVSYMHKVFVLYYNNPSEGSA